MICGDSPVVDPGGTRGHPPILFCTFGTRQGSHRSGENGVDRSKVVEMCKAFNVAMWGGFVLWKCICQITKNLINVIDWCFCKHYPNGNWRPHLKRINMFLGGRWVGGIWGHGGAPACRHTHAHAVMLKYTPTQIANVHLHGYHVYYHV